MIDLCQNTSQVAMQWLMTGISIGTAAGFLLSALIRWVIQTRD